MKHSGHSYNFELTYYHFLQIIVILAFCWSTQPFKNLLPVNFRSRKYHAGTWHQSDSSIIKKIWEVQWFPTIPCNKINQLICTPAYTAEASSASSPMKYKHLLSYHKRGKIIIRTQDIILKFPVFTALMLELFHASVVLQISYYQNQSNYNIWLH